MKDALSNMLQAYKDNAEKVKNISEVSLSFVSTLPEVPTHLSANPIYESKFVF